jgi:hypothetical protein
MMYIHWIMLKKRLKDVVKIWHSITVICSKLIILLKKIEKVKSIILFKFFKNNSKKKR